MNAGNENNGHDRVLDHTREQLSALFDGALALDEARFLQRRLQHDADLAGCVSRWQLIGDALRGQAAAAAPAGFSARVAAAVAAEPAPGRVEMAATASKRRRWVPGAALAASVAMVAWFAMRQAPDAAASAEAPPTQVAQAALSPAVPAALAPDAAIPAHPGPAQPGTPAPDSVGQLATAAMAVATVPRRIAARRTPSRAQVQRAATSRIDRQAQEDASPQLAVASGNPFAPADGLARQATPRPWPRALLPNAGTAFNVGYGSLQRGAEAFHPEPFHPFRPAPPVQAPQVQAPQAPAPQAQAPQAQDAAPAP
jgi:negative regulator of sigma E activity